MHQLEFILMMLTCLSWIIGILFAIFFEGKQEVVSGISLQLSRISLAFGCLILAIASFMMLITGTVKIPLFIHLVHQEIYFYFNTSATWLLLFGSITSFFVCLLGSTEQCLSKRRFWLIGLGMSFFGALGVFGLQDATSFLIAWELMSLGGAVVIFGESLSASTQQAVFYMLALLEVGAVAILLGLMTCCLASGGTDFSYFLAGVQHLPGIIQFFLGVLFLIGFGAKLGILPFYEWFPGAYGSGSGASGALFSGLILNAGFFALMRTYFEWLPANEASFSLGILVSVVAVLSAILAILYGFQQADWRRLLSLSSAENASIAVLLLGTALLFHHEGFNELASLAIIVSLVHMAGHCLAKGALFFTADSIYSAINTYIIAQVGLLKKQYLWGIGVLFAAMSLSAIPPQIGFLSEWYAFQTIFQGFHLMSLTGRITLVFIGAGLALSSAIALATFIKLIGIGLLGAPRQSSFSLPWKYRIIVFLLGLLVLCLAVFSPWWINVLDPVTFKLWGMHVVQDLHVGWVMVPLSQNFAFTSPAMLVLVIVGFACFPACLLLRIRAFSCRRERVWFGGRVPDKVYSSETTALTFANSLRVLYKFIYRPVAKVDREINGAEYFSKKVIFNHSISMFFERLLFKPIVKIFDFLAVNIQKFQSGDINFYNAIIALLLLLAMLSVVLF